ncbi:MAG: type IV pilus secretin PilQ [Methylococcaceae bacterium]
MSMQNKKMKLQGQPVIGWFMAGFFILLIQASTSWAGNSAITELNISSLAGGEVQIQLGMNSAAIAPKIFQTDNPSRIALDFAGVKSELPKKMYTINQGAANTVYVVQASGRTRVVINLSQTVPYETKVDGNNLYITLKPVNSIKSVETPVQGRVADPVITNFLPEQTIKSIDFRRGPKGEGRLLLELTTKNTVVDVIERGGKVILNFLNTRLPENLIKSFDVADFATPVRKIDARPRGAGVNIIVTPVDGNYDYSSYQSDRLLTIDFIPLSKGEKEALLKKKFPYIGKKLTLNFQDIEVRSVLQILADFTDLNIIAADSVGGTVTLRLNDVPWDQALDLILKSKGLSKRQTGNVVLVAPTSEIIKIEEEELESKKIIEQLEPLRTEYIEINYAKAEDIQMLLTGQSVVKSSSSANNQSNTSSRGDRRSSSNSNRDVRRSERAGLLSERGNSTVDSRTNTLIVKDTARQLAEIHKLIELLDVPVRQVLIEARVVIASTNFSKQLGIEFGIAYKGTDFKLSGRGVETKAVNNSSALSDLATALSASGPGALAMTLSDGANYLLNLEIQANEFDGDTELLSNPRIMTTDRVQATIKQGVQIPYQTSNELGTPTTELVDAVLELEVTPQITPSGSVIMDLRITKDAPGDITLGADSIPIDTREIITTVQVQDGETVVLGGIYESTNSNAQNDVPWVSDLPGIGWLFKNTDENLSKKELLIFVTPKIVKNSLSVR